MRRALAVSGRRSGDRPRPSRSGRHRPDRRNGSDEIMSAADAPLMHMTSWATIWSAERTVAMSCTSFLKPFGQSGLIGRSTMRAVRIARSVGRPSRLKKPPGILPAAYIRSSTSTVSGKKSAPSRASSRPCAVASTIVSPARQTTAPSACLARWPVSNRSSRPPTLHDTSCRWPATVTIAPPLPHRGGRRRRRFEAAPRSGAPSNFHRRLPPSVTTAAGPAPGSPGDSPRDPCVGGS